MNAAGRLHPVTAPVLAPEPPSTPSQGTPSQGTHRQGIPRQGAPRADTFQTAVDRIVVQARTQAPALLIVAGLAALGAITVAGMSSPLIICAVPVAVAFAWFVAQNPSWTAVTIIVVEVTNLSGVLAGRTSLPIFHASVALGGTALILALREEQHRRRLNRWTAVAAVLLACYLAGKALSAIASSDVATSEADLVRAFIDCSFVLLVLMLVQVSGGHWTAAAAFVVPLAVMSAMTLINELVFGGTNSLGGFADATQALGEGITTLRYGGPLPDSNFWGRHLVLGLSLAAALTARCLRAGQHARTAFWLVAASLLLIGIYLTQSRGTFLAAGVALCVFVVLVGPTARRWSVVAIPALIAVLLLTPGIGDRLLSAASEINSSSTDIADLDPSLLGRMSSQEIARLMFTERPVFGYGAGTYGLQVDAHQDQVPTALGRPLTTELAPNAPHNLYLELLAETGVVGLISWAIMFVGFLILGLMGIVSRPRDPDRLLTTAVCAAIVAWGAASITLHIAYFRTFGIILALAAALAPEWPDGRDRVRHSARQAAAVIAAVAAGACTAGIVLINTRDSQDVTEQHVTLRPVGQVDGYYSYALNIRNRKQFLPTVARIIDPDVDGVTVAADPVRGTIRITATAAPTRSRGLVETAVRQAQNRSTKYLGHRQYSFTEVGPAITRTTASISPRAATTAVIAGLLVAVGGWAVLRPTRHTATTGKRNREVVPA